MPRIDPKRYKDSSIEKVIAALNAINEEDKVERNQASEDSSSILFSIQKLQNKQDKRINRLSSLLGTGTGKITPANLHNSPLGKFLSSELKRQMKTFGFIGKGGNLGKMTRTDMQRMLRSSMLGKGSGGLGSAGMLGLLPLLKFLLPAGAVLGAGLGVAYLGNKLGEKLRDSLGQTPEQVKKFHEGLAMGADYMAQDFDYGNKKSSPTPALSNAPSDLLTAGRHDRASRNINPGNVKARTDSDYLGQVGRDEKGHARFATKEAGVAATVNRLYRYNKDKQKGDSLSGKKTLRDIMYIYAPPNENKTETYIRTVAKRVGVSPDQQIDLRSNPELLKKLTLEIMKYESTGWKAYSQAEFDKGIQIGMDAENLGKDEAARIHADYLTTGNNTPTRRAIEQATFEPLKGNLNENLFDATQQARGTRYRLGGKNLASGSIDCSGWAQTAMQRAGAPREIIQQMMGKTAAEQIINTGRSTGTLQETNDLSRVGLKEGMLIGLKNNRNRAMGIGHVGIIVRNPQTGELGVSHSSSSRGVIFEPLDKFTRWANREGGYVLSDPLVASREMKKNEEEKVKEQTNNTALADNTSNNTPKDIAQALSAPTLDTDHSQAPIHRAAENFVAQSSLPKEEQPVKSDSNATPRNVLPQNVQEQTNKVLASSEEHIAPLSSPSGNIRKESIRPNVAKMAVSHRTESPIKQNLQATAQQVLQPIVINQKKDKSEKADNNAGGTLPFRVDSQAVLAFQLDPTTPTHV